MKKAYDFSGGKRGAVIPPVGRKTRITIRIDSDILDWFRVRAHEEGGGSYQTAMNHALRLHVQGQTLTTSFRQLLREELPRYSVSMTAKQPRRRRTASK